jgi:phage transcriptional repressor|nr:MAG TPA: Repressor protein CI [Caudoviricetes sp.]DAW41733.1 MAG TPA: Repressor protein CI [Caudoviricetes sp.]
MRTNSEIVDIIIDLCNQKGWSLSEFARKLDLPKSSISRYFNKSRQLPINKINIFADTLGVSSEYLLGIKISNNDLLDIYNKLETKRQSKVYNFATEQLNEQKNKITNINDYIEEETDWYEVKFYGSISAGTGLYLDDEQVETISFGADMVPSGTDFCLKVNGDSMEPMFNNGDYVFIKRETDFRNGTIGAVIVNGEAYLKKIYITDNSIRLVSLNKKYKDITVSEDDTLNYVGTVVF